jgi:hypothetical protein
MEEPFGSAAEAWFWTVTALKMRHGRARNYATGVPRPCSPDDVLKALDRLYRCRAVDLNDARLLQYYGERRLVPSKSCPAECGDRVVWDRVMGRLEPALQARGIVRRPEPPAMERSS